VPDRKPTLSDIDKAPENLPVAAPEAARTDAEYIKLQSRFTEIADANFELTAENKSLKNQLGSKKAIEDLLGPTSRRAFIFLCGYGIGALAVLLFQGFHVGGFNLPETVLDFLVGSTAVSAIGVFAAVIKGLFEAIKRS
jgi:hypothetical protein